MHKFAEWVDYGLVAALVLGPPAISGSILAFRHFSKRAVKHSSVIQITPRRDEPRLNLNYNAGILPK